MIKRFCFGFLLFIFPNIPLIAQPTFTQYVNPFIGTGGHGHTFPGATVPFAMVQLSPDTRIDGSWDGCGGYHYSDSLLYGFSHTHLSGTGVTDYGDILLLPMNNKPELEDQKYTSHFSHSSERASPGFYAVKLLDDNIDVELTSSLRTGFHKYTFNKDGDAYVYLDLTHRDKLLESHIKIVDEKTIQVYRQSEGWARDQRVYAQIVFSQPFTLSRVVAQQKAFFCFAVKKGEPVYVKVSLSAVDEEGAKKNMEAEIPGWNFEGTLIDAQDAWNKELSKIQVQSEDENKLTIFYTALYHCMIQPNVYSDVDGRYRGRDMQIHKTDGFTYYTVFSLWDTFRAWHPLMTLIDEKRTVDFIKTFLAEYEQGGLLPVWELSSNETECMIGYHSVSVMADAMMKGIQGFDYSKALEAAKKSAETRERYGLGAYIDKGFLEAEDENESVSKTLEYAYDDWCIAQMAKQLNREDDYKTYMERSQSWKNMFDPITGFIRPRSNGGWLKPFDPFEVNNNYTEANAWQYNFFVPQDIQVLINYYGGKKNFEKKLDDLFSASVKTTGREQSDITGLIGQYAHGNEPSHQIAYLYNYTDRPDKAQKIIHQVLNDFYKNAPDGLIGNEDCGQMSAWYVMSSLGFYQVCPGSPNFNMTSPHFSESLIRFSDSTSLKIKVENFAENNFYIQNKNDISTSYTIAFDKLKKSKELSFTLDSTVTDVINKETAIATEQEYPILRVPIISAKTMVFKDSLEIKMESFTPGSKIIYMLQGPFERPAKLVYDKPFHINQSTTINAYVVDSLEQESKWIKASFYKLPHPNWKIRIKGKYNSQYTAGGDEGLLDGLHGDENWRKGRWQGYQSQDFECVIDMVKKTSLDTLSATFLQDSRSWILMPTQIEFEISDDGNKYVHIATLVNDIAPEEEKTAIKKFETILPGTIQARYVKIKAKNFGKLPEWHQGFPFGGEAFIFVDEVEVK